MTDIERSVEGVGRTAASGSRGSVWAYASFAGLAALLSACAGKTKPEVEAPPRDESSYYDDTSSRASSKPHPGDSRDESTGTLTKLGNQESAEPVFTEGMSVDEAIKAVPPGAERRNIDQETLGKPLQDLSLYESCKPGSARFKVRVAVWDGKAVGIDVAGTPKNDKLAACIKGKIGEVTWEKKVKSLNTIEYQF